MGIYKRKQESNKRRIRPRKHALCQESDQGKTITLKKKGRKQTLDQESDQEKKNFIYFFLSLLFSFTDTHLWPLGCDWSL